MNRLRITSFAAALALSGGARADTFVTDYGSLSATDPAENFEADCLGTAEAADCPERAAQLSTELMEILATLEGLSDPDTVGLFKTAATLDDPRLQAIAMRYFSRQPEVPLDLWTNAKEFLFGPDPNAGQPSAELLERSLEDADKELSRIYLEGRPTSEYGGDLPSETGLNDTWAHAQAKDTVLDAVDAFPEGQRFTPTTRLLMIDRFITSALDFESQVPVTGFVTDASVPEVTAHFTQLFGAEPYPPLSTSLAKIDALSEELTSVQAKLLAGDTSVSARLGEILTEMEQVQAAVALGNVLSLGYLECSDHVFWVAIAPEDVYTEPLPRAVTVGTDPHLNRTAIRYINGAWDDSAAPGDGDGDAPAGDGDGDGPSAGDGDDDPSDADAGPDGRKRKSGGGCTVSTHTGTPAPAWLLLTLGYALQMLVRRRR